ncbi:MAG: YdeI/OmpD-associated family protein [Candidatus Dormibacteria bacterium]
MADTLPELIVPDQLAWAAWLVKHDSDRPGVWLVLAKKGTTAPTTLSYEQALDEALCHGWIDGQVRRRDAATYRQRYTPRRSRSRWSENNRENIDRLTREGRMCGAGLAAVERARADGNWAAAYSGPSSIEIPLDLVEALRVNPGAQAMFQSLTSQNRYAVLYRIGLAKQAETRARRIAQFVAMLQKGETAHPQRRGPNG